MPQPCHAFLRNLPLLLLVALFALSATLHAATRSALADHPSPYLALHADDPVAWRTWSAEILVEAQRDNRPIYLSSGYFACHWCHVMQRESFQDAEIAELLNTAFIPVKLDRELHPALDDYLMAFVRKTAGSAGWPLNVFLTPEGYPLGGMAYVAPAQFLAILQRVAKGWAEEGAHLAYNARLLVVSQALTGNPVRPLDTPAETLRDRFYRSSLNLADELGGGIGAESRFPMVPQYLALLELLALQPQPRVEAWLRLTLDRTAALGMRDAIHGGFFRYTTDPDQRTPHFEKMLYDQALLALLYLRAAHQLEHPPYREVAFDTLRFTLDHFAHPEGGYIASLSAVDSEQVEGGGYLWSLERLRKLLTPEQLAFAVAYWQLQGGADFSAGYLPIPNPTHLDPLLKQQVRDRLRAAATRHPADSKRIAAWNGLLLSALSAASCAALDPPLPLGPECAARLQEQPQWAAPWWEAGQQLHTLLLERFQQQGQIHRSLDDAGHGFGEAALEDYAFIAQALEHWNQITGKRHDPALRAILDHAWNVHYTPQGWQPGSGFLLPGMAREAAVAEGPLPSPSATLIALSRNHPDPAIRQQRQRALQQGYAISYHQPFWYPSYQLLFTQPQESP